MALPAILTSALLGFWFMPGRSQLARILPEGWTKARRRQPITSPEENQPARRTRWHLELGKEARRNLWQYSSNRGPGTMTIRTLAPRPTYHVTISPVRMHDARSMYELPSFFMCPTSRPARSGGRGATAKATEMLNAPSLRRLVRIRHALFPPQNVGKVEARAFGGAAAGSIGSPRPATP